MAVVSGVFSNRSQYTLVLTVTQTSQNIPGNYSTIGVDLRINESPNWGSWSNAPLTWAWNVNGTVVGSSTTYDFRNYDVLVLYSNSNALNVAHNANGTKSISFSGAVGGGTTIGNASCSGSMTLTTIPRASTPSFVGGATFEAGATKTINTNRASTSFTHTLQYYIGSSGWKTIATGVGGSTTYEFPEDLLEYMPNSPTGAGILRCYTYSGGTNIGVKDIAFTLTTPSDVVPDWDSVSVSEGNDFVATNVGAYVQGVSTLEYEIVGAAGIYGSSISIQRFSVGSQTVHGASGETPLPISGSGTVPVTWLIQDTRGKQKQQTSNITVLPYSLPAISSLEVERALSDGTPDPDEGTYLNVDIIALVQSLMNVTQKNVMQIKIRARELGDNTPWNDASTLKETINPGTVTYNDVVTVAGPFDIDKSYEVRVEVVDLFNVAASQATIPVAAVFMHWAEDGLGLGKYRENGMLDVNGAVYAPALFQNGRQTLSYQQRIIFTSSGTFTKASYPWLRAMRVTVVGGGGSGAGAGGASGGQNSYGTGGGSGAYAESFITDIAGLDSSITVTVGAGGAATAAGSIDGTSGGSSSFGSLVVAGGGFGGNAKPNSALGGYLGGGHGGVPTAGQIQQGGSPGGNGWGGDTLCQGGNGGSSIFGGGARGAASPAGGAANEGAPGTAWGAGGSGAAVNAGGSARAGGAGASGVVIVELYA